MTEQPKPVGYCTEHARKGTGWGMCDRPLDDRGECDRAGDHVPSDEARAQDWRHRQ